MSEVGSRVIQRALDRQDTYSQVGAGSPGGELRPPPFHAIWTGRQRDEAPRISPSW
jgi:hypothetical protein